MYEYIKQQISYILYEFFFSMIYDMILHINVIYFAWSYIVDIPNFFRKKVCLRYIFAKFIYIYIRNTSLEKFEKVFVALDFFYDFCAR